MMASTQCATDVAWPLLADFVAEVRGGHVLRKNRIRIAGTANLSCAAALCGESMLRATARKILLQQYLPGAAVRDAAERCFIALCALKRQTAIASHLAAQSR